MTTIPHIETDPQLLEAGAAHRILRLAIIGGFLDGAQFEFSDGLNCIIGARGTGKTTVFELIRFVLDAIPSSETQTTERRRIESLVEKNLAGGRVELTIVTKDSLKYVVTRSAGEEPIVLTADGKPTGISLRSSGGFRADIYSQNEVETIADVTSAQLGVIDNFEAEQITEANVQVRRLQAELEASANHMLPLQQQIDAMSEELVTLDGVQERLKQFTDTGDQDSAAINEAHARKSVRDREQRAAARLREVLRQGATDVSSLRERLAHLGDAIDDRDITNGPNAAIVAQMGQQVKRCKQAVENALDQATNQVVESLSELAALTRTLHNAHAEQELEFRSLIEQHNHVQATAAERVKLERRRNELMERQREKTRLEEKLAGLAVQRSELLERFRRIQDERFAIRESVAQRISARLAPAIRVAITQFANPERYQRLLESALRSAHVRHLVVAQKLVDAFWPAELARLVRQRDAAALVEQAKLNTDQCGKVLAALSQPALLFRLEAVELLDSPRIELKDGDSYKDSLSLSTGQKCTTILPILLLDSENPLLVDQPEDNLDNRFIFQAIVDSIRKVRLRRQLIFVTHNPNIPVLGDAERVFVLDSNGSSARKACEGSVDEVKPDIVTLLEGGEDAFKARKTRYAY